MMLRDLRSTANIFLHFHLAGGLPWSVSDRLNVVVVCQVAERPSSKPRSKQLQWVAPADFFKKSVEKYSQIVLNFFRSAYLRFLHHPRMVLNTETYKWAGRMGWILSLNAIW